MEPLEVRHSSLSQPTIPVEAVTTVLEILSDAPKQAQTVALESQTQLLPTLFKAIPVPLVISRIADGAILYANEHYCSTFGLAIDQMCDRESVAVATFIESALLRTPLENPKGSANRAQQTSEDARHTLDFYCDSVDRQTLLQLLATQGYVCDYEVKMQKADGTPIWLAVSLQWLTFNGEQTILGVFHNITQYKQASEAVNQQLATLNEILAANPKILLANSENLTPQPPSLRGKGGLDSPLLLGEGQGEGSKPSLIDQQYHSNHFYRCDSLPCGSPCGEWDRSASGEVGTKKDENTSTEEGQPNEFFHTSSDFQAKPAELVSAFDITANKQAQKALHESQRTLSTLMSNLPGMAYRRRNDWNWTLEFVSEGCLSLTGYHFADLIDQQKISLTEITHPEDRKRVWHEVQAALNENRPYQLEYRITTATGEHKWVWEQGRGVFSAAGELVAMEGFVTDITERKRSCEELQLLQTMTQAISEAPDFDTAIEVALCKVCEATSWDFGEAWIESTDAKVLECSTAWYSSKSDQKYEVRSMKDENTLAEEGEPTESFHTSSFTLETSLSEFRRQSEAFTFAPDSGLPGRVWSTRQPVWIRDVSLDPESFFARPHLAKACGLKAGFGVPILADDQVLAVLVFFMFESRQEDRRLVELISAVAAQLGVVIQRKQAEAALRESQRRLASLIDALPGIVFSCASDPEWSMTYLSEGCLTLTGYKSEELIGNRAVSFDAITHQEDLPKVLAALEMGVTQKQPYIVEYRIRTKSGQEKWVWEKGHGVFDSNGSVLGIEGFITDITERKRAEEALRQAEAKYRSIFENALEGVFQSTADGYYLSANPALARLYGYSTPDELMERLTDIEHQLYVDPERRAEFIRLLQENDAVSEFESQVCRKDGSVIWISENARAVRSCDTGELLYYEGSVEDITERKRVKEQLQERAFYDPLTRLANRALFMDRLSHTVERAKRHPEYRFAVLFLDLDRFKIVNDSLGHLIGDRLLVAIARRLECCLRAEDTVARLGGDEFTILLENIEDVNQAIRVAQRIHQELIAPFNLDGHEVFTGASIGIVLSREVKKGVCPTDYDRPEDFLRDADTALYRAKALGKGRYEVFDTTL